MRPLTPQGARYDGLPVRVYWGSCLFFRKLAGDCRVNAVTQSIGAGPPTDANGNIYVEVAVAQEGAG